MLPRRLRRASLPWRWSSCTACRCGARDGALGGGSLSGLTDAAVGRSGSLGIAQDPLHLHHCPKRPRYLLACFLTRVNTDLSVPYT